MSEKTRKYLLYAIGEILLVVIGILIALQVNNWNEERINRIEERALLESLRNEFVSNQQQLNEKVALRETSATSAFQLLQMIGKPPVRFSNADIDSLLLYAIPSFTFDPQYGVMNQLIESGKLSLVRDDSLRDLISNWSGIIDDLEESETYYADFNMNELRPFLYEHGDYRSMVYVRNKTGFLNTTLIDHSALDTTEIGPSVFLADPGVLLSSKQFENLLASLYSHLTYVNAQSYGVDQYMNRVVSRIDLYLSNSGE